MRILVLVNVLGAVLALCMPGVALSQESAAKGEPMDCTKLQGLDAQMACLKQHIDGLKAMSANAEPIETLPPDEPRITGDRSSAACHARGKSQPVWPNGQPMGPTANIDQCVENHGVAQADFVEFCEAGLGITQQAGPGNVVLRYLDKCPAGAKSKCSLKGLPRAGSDEDDPSTYTARVDFHFNAANSQQADEAGCVLPHDTLQAGRAIGDRDRPGGARPAAARCAAAGEQGREGSEGKKLHVRLR